MSSSARPTARTESASSALTSGLEAVGAGRLVRLRTWMADQEVDAAYVTRAVSIAYLAGFHAETQERLMALTVRQEGATLIVPAIERDRAAQVAGDFGVVGWRDGEDPYVLVREALTGADAIAVEKDHLTVRSAEALQAMAGVRGLADVSGEIRALRRTKSAAELEKRSEEHTSELQS